MTQEIQIPVRSSYLRKYLVHLCLLLSFIIPGKSQNDAYISKKIQGDWASGILKINKEERRLRFSFEDSLCRYSLGDYTNYKIENQSLVITRSFLLDDSILIKEFYHFKIIRLTDDALQLSPLIGKTDNLYDDFFSGFDTITLYKVKSKNNIVPSRISFYSSYCLSNCPSISLEIDSNRRVKFYGGISSSMEGGFSGMISQKEYAILLNKINNLPFDSILPFYDAQYDDDQTCGIIIDYQNKSFRSVADGEDKEPVELRILFDKLLEVYKMIALRKDSIDFLSFFHKELYDHVYIPQPPLPDKLKHDPDPYKVSKITDTNLVNKVREFISRLSKGEKLASLMSNNWTMIYYDDDRCKGLTQGQSDNLSPDRVDESIKIQVVNNGEGWECFLKPPTLFDVDFKLSDMVKDWKKTELSDTYYWANEFDVLGGSASLRITYTKVNGNYLIIKMKYWK